MTKDSSGTQEDVYRDSVGKMIEKDIYNGVFNVTILAYGYSLCDICS
jgi:hypothetical protein